MNKSTRSKEIMSTHRGASEPIILRITCSPCWFIKLFKVQSDIQKQRRLAASQLKVAVSLRERISCHVAANLLRVPLVTEQKVTTGKNLTWLTTRASELVGKTPASSFSRMINQ